MATDISWSDQTWNIVTGCVKVSMGCKFCYAERLALRHWTGARPWIAPNADHNVTLHPERLTEPATWRKPRTIFVCSMADLFIEQVPDAYIVSAFGVMAAYPRHVFLVLTKRPERARLLIDRICQATHIPHLPGHIWIGVSAERQAEFDQRVPVLLQIRATHRFVSLEPLLGPIDLGASIYPSELCSLCGQPKPLAHTRRPGDERYLGWPACGNPLCEAYQQPTANARFRHGLSWVIAGGESGDAPGQIDRWLVEQIDRRDWLPTPNGHRWMRSIRDQCAQAGVHFHMKQWGGPRYDTGGRTLDGVTHDWYPQPQPAAVQGVLL